MTQQEIQQFLLWCETMLKGCESLDCDESWHTYVDGQMIGGWAGDRRQFFIKENDTTAKFLRMMDASNGDSMVLRGIG